MDRANQKLGSFRETVTSTAGSYISGGLIGIATAAVSAGASLLLMANSGAAAAKELRLLNIQTGISIEMLQALGTAGGDEGFARAMIHMQRAIRQASPEVAAAFSRMGLSIAELRGMNPDQQLQAIFAAFPTLTDQIDRASTAMELFGRSGINMIEPLSRGTAGLDVMRERARRFGLDMTREQSDAIARSNREWGNFGLAMRGIGQQLAVAFAPAWEAVGKVGGQVGEFLVGAVKAAAPYVQVLADLWIAFFRMLADWAGIVGDMLLTPFRSLAAYFGIDLKGAWQGFWEAMAKGWIAAEYLMNHWRDGMLLAFRLIQVEWLQLQYRIFGGDALRQEIAAIRGAIAKSAFTHDFVNYVNNRYAQLFGGAAAAAAAATAPQLRALGQPAAHGAAERGSEAAFSLLYGKDSGIQRLLERMLPVQQAQARDVRDMRGFLQFAPVVRAANF